jgi:hypothetical protein
LDDRRELDERGERARYPHQLHVGLVRN